MPSHPAGDVARIRSAARLRGRLSLPGDKSITHRALILAAIAAGEARVLDGSDGLDCNSTAAVLSSLGVAIERLGDPVGGRVDRLVRSPGLEGWREPDGPLDAGNSGTTLRLMAGVVAGLPMYAVFDGDASLRRRPVARIIEPLRQMGATLLARAADSLPPVTVAGQRPLRGIQYRTPVPSAQVKSSILLAGLSADGYIEVREGVPTRDHTERMLLARGVRAESSVGSEEGQVHRVGMEGGQRVMQQDERVPGDVSAAAFWLVAGAAHPDAELVIEHVGVNPTRRAVIDLLIEMGARIDVAPRPADGSEPTADLTVRSSDLEAIELGPADVARAIDEIPALCVAAACARGVTRIRGAGELRHKESDRVAGVADGLRAFGARVDVEGDDLIVRGGAGRPGFGLRGTDVEGHDDHRLAMAFSIAGLLARGESAIHGAASAAVSYPGFFDQCERVRA